MRRTYIGSKANGSAYREKETAWIGSLLPSIFPYPFYWFSAFFSNHRTVLRNSITFVFSYIPVESSSPPVCRNAYVYFAMNFSTKWNKRLVVSTFTELVFPSRSSKGVLWPPSSSYTLERAICFICEASPCFWPAFSEPVNQGSGLSSRSSALASPLMLMKHNSLCLELTAEVCHSVLFSWWNRLPIPTECGRLTRGYCKITGASMAMSEFFWIEAETDKRKFMLE